MGSGHVYFGSLWFISLGQIKKSLISRSHFLDSKLAGILFLDFFFFFALCILFECIYIFPFMWYNC